MGKVCGMYRREGKGMQSSVGKVVTRDKWWTVVNMVMNLGVPYTF